MPSGRKPFATRALLFLLALAGLQSSLCPEAYADWGTQSTIVGSTPAAACKMQMDALNSPAPPVNGTWTSFALTANPPGGLYSADYNCTLYGTTKPGWSQLGPTT